MYSFIRSFNKYVLAVCVHHVQAQCWWAAGSMVMRTRVVLWQSVQLESNDHVISKWGERSEERMRCREQQSRRNRHMAAWSPGLSEFKPVSEIRIPELLASLSFPPHWDIVAQRWVGLSDPPVPPNVSYKMNFSIICFHLCLLRVERPRSLFYYFFFFLIS